MYKLNDKSLCFSKATADTLTAALNLMKDYSLGGEDILVDAIKSYCELWDDHQRCMYIEE
jgi:hypothetical protein